MFILGALLGFLVAFSQLMIKKEKATISAFAEYVALQMSDIDISRIIPDSILNEELFGNLTSMLYPKDKTLGDVTPGLSLKELGAKPNYPVFIIPGIISTVFSK